MFEWDDIIILGDSFATFQNKSESWTYQLLNKLTDTTNIDSSNQQIKKPRGAGYSGCSWWSVRQKFIAELKIKVPKVLIICHTEPNRLPSDHNLPLNFVSVQNIKKHILYDRDLLKYDYEGAAKAAVMYYKHLASEEFNNWAQLRWFSELDAITKYHNIPYVIHMNCFYFPVLSEFEFENGMTVEEILWDSCSERRMWDKNPGVSFNNDTSLINHFTPAENKLLANCLYDAINTYSVGKRKIGFELCE